VVPLKTCCFISFSLNVGNDIDAKGALKLAEALKSNISLTWLILSSNKLDYSLMYELSQTTDNNKQIWKKIHQCIRTNDFSQLNTLLSKRPINLNSFNLSENGDNILHSAAKSNDVKMMEYVLQRISPSSKQRLLKMRNNQNQLPADLGKIWTPSTHSLCPLKFRQVVKAVLMLGAKRQDGTPYYPQTHFYKLPKDVLFLILQYCCI
jgi:hypothetical protein